MFYFYAYMLMLSGALLLILGAAVPGQTAGYRVLNLAIGAGMFGYGFYLRFLFEGGHYIVFWYAFAAPILLAVRTFQARRAAAHRKTSARGAADAATAARMAQPGTAGQAGPPPHWGVAPTNYPPAAEVSAPPTQQHNHHQHQAPTHHVSPPTHHVTPPTHHVSPPTHHVSPPTHH